MSRGPGRHARGQRRRGRFAGRRRAPDRRPRPAGTSPCWAALHTAAARTWRLGPARVRLIPLARWQRRPGCGASLRRRGGLPLRLARLARRPVEHAQVAFWRAVQGDRSWRWLEPGLWNYERAFGPVIDRAGAGPYPRSRLPHARGRRPGQGPGPRRGTPGEARSGTRTSFWPAPSPGGTTPAGFRPTSRTSGNTPGTPTRW